MDVAGSMDFPVVLSEEEVRYVSELEGFPKYVLQFRLQTSDSTELNRDYTRFRKI